MATFVERCTTNANGADPADNLRELMSIEQSAPVEGVESEGGRTSIRQDYSSRSPLLRVDGTSVFASTTDPRRGGGLRQPLIRRRQPLYMFYNRRTSADSRPGRRKLHPEAIFHRQHRPTTLTSVVRSEKSRRGRLSLSPPGVQSCRRPALANTVADVINRPTGRWRYFTQGRTDIDLTSFLRLFVSIDFSDLKFLICLRIVTNKGLK